MDRTTPFVLTPHEVMRGIRVNDDVLVLRPIGWVQAACWTEFALASAGVVALAVAGGAWWLLVPVVVILAANAVLRRRVAVFATPELVTVRNRWRRQRVPLLGVQKVGTKVVRWPVRQPAYLFTRTSFSGRSWEVGTIGVRSGGSIECDALVSVAPESPTRSEVTPAAMKAEVLERWVAAHQAHQEASPPTTETRPLPASHIGCDPLTTAP